MSDMIYWSLGFTVFWALVACTCFAALYVLWLWLTGMGLVVFRASERRKHFALLGLCISIYHRSELKPEYYDDAHWQAAFPYARRFNLPDYKVLAVGFGLVPWRLRNE